MTFSSLYNTCSFILLLQLLIFTSNLFLRTNSASVVQDVCSKTKSPPLCLSVLGSDSRSRTANLPQLAQIALDMAEYNGGITKIKIHEFILSTNDRNLKNLYYQCENYYLDALNALLIALKDLPQWQYNDLKARAVSVGVAVASCEAVFKNKSPFTKENQKERIVADAIAIIADDLSK